MLIKVITSKTKVRCFRQRSSPSLPSRVTWTINYLNSKCWREKSLTQVFVFFQTRNWRESASEASNRHLLNPVCLPSNLSEDFQNLQIIFAQMENMWKEVNLSTANGAQTPLSWRVKHTLEHVSAPFECFPRSSYPLTLHRQSGWSPCGRPWAQVGLAHLFQDHQPNFLIHRTPAALHCLVLIVDQKKSGE